MDRIGKICACGVTHQGLVRPGNQDSYLVRELAPAGVLLAVADGLGGQAGGDRASAMVVDFLAHYDPGPGWTREHLAQMVTEANKAVLAEAKRRPKYEHMGTTLTAVALQGDRATWVHVGDSRLYLLRVGRLEQITVDQNLARFLFEEGEISEEEMETHPARNLLDQCVGCPECRPALGGFKLRSGDCVLVSTDGLFTEVPGPVIADRMTAASPLKERTTALVQAALDGGGRDNITVVAAEIMPGA